MHPARTPVLYRAGTALIAALSLHACVGDPPESTAAGTPVASNGQRYTVTLDAASVPIHRGVNDITMHVRTTDGAPATLLTLRAWMPAHGHETYPLTIVPGEPGVFTAQGLTLTMAGEWALDLGLASGATGTGDDRATLWAAVE